MNEDRKEEEGGRVFTNLLEKDDGRRFDENRKKRERIHKVEKNARLMYV